MTTGNTADARPSIIPPPGRALRVGVLGQGQMGLVCAGILASDDPATGAGEAPPPEVLIWGKSPPERERLGQTRTSPRLHGFTLPQRVRVALRDDELARADLIVAAIPVQHLRAALLELRPHIAPHAGVISVAKGIENGALKRPTEVIAETLGSDRPIGALSGPTIAAELARALPATMIATSTSADFACAIQRIFGASWLRIYTNPDVVGVELAGALKNVIAIAAGILDGLNAGYNAKSALLARGLAEIVRLGVAMGGTPDTFFGIAGVGDLATSCFSPEGRNRACGEALGRGMAIDRYMEGVEHVIEGIWTTRSVVELATRHNVEMPIVRGVYAVLFEGLDPLRAIDELMRRELKREQVN